MTILKGWKYVTFIGTFVGVLGLAIYPVIISPIINPEEYKKMQKVNRAGVVQEKIQPGNMKVWSDPFDRK